MTERVIAAARAKADPVFASRVAAWETRLAPLNDDFAPLDAPNLMPKIEARLFPVADRPRRGISWGFLGGAITAGVLAVAILMSQDPVRTGPVLTAQLASATEQLAFAARFDASAETLTLTRTGGTAAASDKDLQLWVIGADGVPSSLGLLRADEVTVVAKGLAPGLVLAVSLEPLGGSPKAVPTGPVLITGVLAQG